MKSIEDYSVDELADAIFDISKAAKTLKNTGLTERAIILLIHDLCKVNKRDIKAVLEALPQLKDVYLEQNETNY